MLLHFNFGFADRLIIANLAKWKDFYSYPQFLVPMIPKSARGLIYDFHRVKEY